MGRWSRSRHLKRTHTQILWTITTKESPRAAATHLHSLSKILEACASTACQQGLSVERAQPWRAAVTHSVVQFTRFNHRQIAQECVKRTVCLAAVPKESPRVAPIVLHSSRT